LLKKEREGGGGGVWKKKREKKKGKNRQKIGWSLVGTKRKGRGFKRRKEKGGKEHA